MSPKLGYNTPMARKERQSRAAGLERDPISRMPQETRIWRMIRNAEADGYTDHADAFKLVQTMLMEQRSLEETVEALNSFWDEKRMSASA